METSPISQPTVVAPSAPESTTPERPMPTMSQLLKLSWEAFKRHPFWTYAIIIVPMAISVLMQWFLVTVLKASDTSIILMLVDYIIITAITIGTLTVGLKIVRGEKLEANDWIDKVHRVFYYIFGSILIGVFCTLGLILFIVPGIYLVLRFIFVPTLLIDTELGIFDALRVSGEMTRGIKWKLFWYGLGFGALAVLGFIVTLGLGILIIAPLASLLPLVLYVQLQTKNRA